ncbi:MAG: rhomboid family intramembrane serine protease [Gemmataceae bacterium]|nr:rhomboid family intramembrane serine protease [Gemmataceae bacterium]
MGIYDREYYRKEGPSFLESFQLRGQACKWLIVLNVVFFALQLLTRDPVRVPGTDIILFWQPGAFTEALTLDVDKVFQGQVWRLLTYAFLHDPGVGFAPGHFYLHIVFNMWFLWLFGQDLEELYGPREFVSFYLVAAVVGGLAFLVAGAMTGQRLCVGASGAVTAVIILTALHFPNRMILLFFVLPMPIWVFAIFQVAQDSFLFLSQSGPQQFNITPTFKSRVAVSVHLGGAAFALLYHKLQWRLSGIIPSLAAWRRARSRPRLRVYREDEPRRPSEAITAAPPAPSASTRDVDEQLEAKLDAILEKVARSGQDSLTDSERALLLKASEIYKRRRS